MRRGDMSSGHVHRRLSGGVKVGLKDGQAFSLEMDVRGEKSEGSRMEAPEACSAHRKPSTLPCVYTGHMGGGVE